MKQNMSYKLQQKYNQKVKNNVTNSKLKDQGKLI